MGYMTERAAYIRGLADGLNLKDDGEGRLLKAIVKFLEDAADSIDEMQLQLDEVDDDLAAVENDLYSSDEDDEDDVCDYDDEDFECEEIECPHCHETIFLDDDFLKDEEETFICPNCKKEIELEFDCGDGSGDDGDDDEEDAE